VPRSPRNEPPPSRPSRARRQIRAIIEAGLRPELCDHRVRAHDPDDHRGAKLARQRDRQSRIRGAKRSLFTRQDFIYDAEKDHYTCPAGQHLTRGRRPIGSQAQR